MEIKSEKLKVAFFFGAGVEGKGNFDIESGYDYLKRSLFASTFSPQMLDALAQKFHSKDFLTDIVTARMEYPQTYCFEIS